MKTPDEIKKGLALCIDNEAACIGCPYDDVETCHCDLMEDAFALIQQLEAKAPKWISVEDEQKPQHHKEVLCRYIFDGDSECFYAVLTYYAYGDNGYVTGSHFTGEGLHDMRVTHWMPLPEPPTEV